MTSLFFENFTFWDWFLLTLGCVLVILIPALFILITVKITSAILRFVISLKGTKTHSISDIENTKKGPR